MEFRVLGSLEVLDPSGRRVTPTGDRLRGLLAVLLLHANEAVSTDRLIDELWGENAPATAAKVVQNLMSQLRKTIPGRLETRGHSYVLHVEPGELDLERFQALVDEAHRCRATDDLDSAAAKLDSAVSLWRGAALADLDHERLALEVDWLEELRLAAVEERAAVELERGGGAELVGELEQLVRDQPLRERLRGELMLALYRAGRQADALDAYRRARTTLVEQLGIEPGEELRRLEQAILRHDPALEPVNRTRTTRERARLLRRRRPSVAIVAGALLLIAAAATAAGLALDRGKGRVVAAPNSVAVIDPGSGHLVATIPVGAHPDAIAIGAGSAWVANADDGTLSRIDLKTKKVVANIGIGGPVADVATDGRFVWTVTGSEGTLVTVDARTNAVVNRLDLSGRNAVMPAGAYSVATAKGTVWVGTSAAGGTLLRVDAARGNVSRRLVRGWVPAAIATSRDSVWIALSVGGVVRLGTADNAVTASLGQPAEATSIALGNGSLWIGDPGSWIGQSEVWQLSPDTATVMRTVRIRGLPMGIAIENDAVWVAGGDSGVLTEIDQQSGTVRRSLDLGGSLLDVAYGAGSVWVAVSDPLRSTS